MRIGLGFDVHELVVGRELIIGGVKIEHDKGLLGHSDADVLVHAINDAIIGALCLGDIGKLFPDNDPKYKDISSLIMTKEVVRLMKEKGYKIGNVDSVICAQKPKLAGFILEMRNNISKVLETDIENISIKATTTEHLGFEGREEGISSHAVVLLEKIKEVKMKKVLFTSESVTEGHPDKICDQISDAVLDEILKVDPVARVACETLTTTGIVMVVGEITTSEYVDIQSIVRNVLKDIGYTRAKYGFDASTCSVVTSINEQSRDIALGVDSALEYKKGNEDKYNSVGAGDQGMMFGYACTETEEFMPLPITLAHNLSKRLSYVRKNDILPYLRPDGKSQVTVEYIDGIPNRIEAIVVSTQHSPSVKTEQIEKDIKEVVINEVIPSNLIDKNTKIYVNPTGRFEIGGPMGDAGLTGRKIIVDTYGGFGRHGGGAFSGKDPTKVDRSGAYMARYIAKNIVASGICEKLEIGISYAIGVAKPLSIYVDTFGTGKISDDEIIEIVKKVFDLRPAAIIDILDLRRPIYRQIAAYGHFGRIDLDLPWERLDKIEEIKKLI